MAFPSRIEDRDLWRRMPLHTTLDGIPVSAEGERVYLAAQGARSGDPLMRDAILIAPSRSLRVLTQQKDWLRPLDDRARIEIALGTVRPSDHWGTVMGALTAIGERAIDDELRAKLRRTAWLPASHDATGKPEDVIDVPESLGDEVHRVITRYRADHGSGFAVPAEMDAALRDHSGWELLRKMGFSSGDEGLDRLGRLLKDLPEYHIGTWSNAPEPDELALLSRCELLPGWRLLQVASAAPFDLAIAWAKLGPAISKELDSHRVAEALNWLSAAGDQREPCKLVFDTYLSQFAVQGQAAQDHLPRLRLATADGQWREAGELCTGAHGVARDRLLDETQGDILKALVCRASVHLAAEGQPIRSDADPQAGQHPTRAVLREYFEPWNSNLVPAPMVGVVLALLGRDACGLVDECLHPHSFEWLTERLSWSEPDQRPRPSRRTSAEIVDCALALVRVTIQVETGDDVEVLNVLGKSMRVALDQEPDTLLAGAVRWPRDLGVNTPMPRVVALTASEARADVSGYEATVPLRRMDPVGIQAERLGDLLRATAELLYADLYGQPINAGFGALWQALDRSDQLDIGIARRLILDHVPFYLRQISVKSDEIERRLADCDSGRRRIAEAEADHLPTEQHRKQLRTDLDGLAGYLDGNTDEQHTVLRAVKARLEQYQYELSSIPFELFQNADDAAVELGQFCANPSQDCAVPDAARRFVVAERDDGLGFLHWGRPINARGPVRFGRERGYDRDLEKMLILSASDKSREDGVTGKFGLGFKSVLLACEQPRILSGRLALRVVSGILPQPWEDAGEARQRIVDLAHDLSLPGTLIDLPGVCGTVRDRVLDRFRELAGILCVFGRALRSITWVAASESTLHWQPTEPCTGVEVGDLDLRGDWGSRTRAICVRTGGGSLLMALGPRGFRALPDAVPALWVTAPTCEPATAGFAINASFDLDAGRGRLAGNTGTNRELAERMGVETGEALGRLLQGSRDDWRSLRARLGLTADLEDLDFWESVWLGLTKTCLRHGGGDGTALVRKVALGALARLSDRPLAIPNGLKGRLRGFTDAGRIRYELSDLLQGPDVGETLGGWTRFTASFSATSSVSGEIAHVLREGDLCDPPTLGLSALVDLLDRSRAHPSDAAVLGRLLAMTRNAPDWSCDELRRRLDKVLFRSDAGQWVEPRHLLTLRGTSLEPDEGRRHALAPPECRLHPEYYVEANNEWPAVTFFLFCRQRMEAPAEKIAQWILHAESEEARSAALEYLADGDLGERVADCVREKTWLRAALSALPNFTHQQADRLRRRLASGYQITRVVEPVAPPPPPPSSPEHVLGAVYDWWRREAGSVRRAYEQAVYPSGFLPSALPLADSEGHSERRTEWFTMLALACYQLLGRTQDPQHLGFIQRGEREGWWPKLAKSRPPDDFRPWLESLERWSEPNQDDQAFLLWKRTLVDLYTIARGLDDYVLLIRKWPGSIREGSGSLDFILRPSTSADASRLGADAAPIDRSLGIGVNWLIRELMRHGFYRREDEELLAPYCWAPTQRVRTLVNALGAKIAQRPDIAVSRDIHGFVVKHIADRARFDGDFDLPLQIVTRSKHRKILERCFEKAGIEAPRFREGSGDGAEYPAAGQTR